MSGPVPIGFVRLTSIVGGYPIMFPASRVCVYIDGRDNTLSISVCGEPNLDGSTYGWRVAETFDEIQAALVRALGAQPEPAP